MLVRAKRPVFVFGSQAVLPPVSADKLRECVENIAIPCFLGLFNEIKAGSFVNKSFLNYTKKKKLCFGV